MKIEDVNINGIDWVEIAKAAKHLQHINGEAIAKLQKKVLLPNQLDTAKALQSILALVEVIQAEMLRLGEIDHSYIQPEDKMTIVTTPLSLELMKTSGFEHLSKPITDDYGIQQYGVNAYWVPTYMVQGKKSLREWQENLAMKAEDIASEVFVSKNKFIPFTDCPALRLLVGGRWESSPIEARAIIQAYNNKLTELLLANGVPVDKMPKRHNDNRLIEAGIDPVYITDDQLELIFEPENLPAFVWDGTIDIENAIDRWKQKLKAMGLSQIVIDRAHKIHFTD